MNKPTNNLEQVEELDEMLLSLEFGEKESPSHIKARKNLKTLISDAYSKGKLEGAETHHIKLFQALSLANLTNPGLTETFDKELAELQAQRSKQ